MKNLAFCFLLFAIFASAAHADAATDSFFNAVNKARQDFSQKTAEIINNANPGANLSHNWLSSSRVTSGATQASIQRLDDFIDRQPQIEIVEETIHCTTDMEPAVCADGGTKRCVDGKWTPCQTARTHRQDERQSNNERECKDRCREWKNNRCEKTSAETACERENGKEWVCEGTSGTCRDSAEKTACIDNGGGWNPNATLARNGCTKSQAWIDCEKEKGTWKWNGDPATSCTAAPASQRESAEAENKRKCHEEEKGFWTTRTARSNFCDTTKKDDCEKKNGRLIELTKTPEGYSVWDCHIQSTAQSTTTQTQQGNQVSACQNKTVLSEFQSCCSDMFKALCGEPGVIRIENSIACQLSQPTTDQSAFSSAYTPAGTKRRHIEASMIVRNSELNSSCNDYVKKNMETHHQPDGSAFHVLKTTFEAS